MKDALQILPREVAPLVASARRQPDPPPEAWERIRSRLGRAFVDHEPDKQTHLREQPPLRAIRPSARPTHRQDRWLASLARAAVTLIFAHAPLAFGGLAVVVAAVPITRVFLNRTESRAPEHQGAPKDRRVPHPARTHAGTETPSIPVPPPLAPLPTLFPAPDPSVAAPPPSVARPQISRATPPSPVEVPTDDLTLATERGLLEQARLALLRGDAIGAVASLDLHEARYPNSQLAEERAALSIQALFRSGRVGEARQRGIEFRRRYPSSLLAPALDAALREEPSDPRGR